MPWSRPRVCFFIVAAALFASVQSRNSGFAAHPGITHTLLFKGAAPGTDEQVIVWDTEYAPGAINPRHFHPTAVTFRILSGTGIWRDEGKPPVTHHAGDIFLAPAGAVHSHWNPSATEKLRFLELIVAPEGKEHSVPRP